MGPPPYQGDWGKKIVTERRYLARFGGEIHASRTGAFGLVVRNLLFSREYTLADRANYFRGILGSMRLLWPELNQVDLFESVPELKVPVFFMEGRSDWESPYEVAERYFEAIKGAVEGADLVRPVGAPAQFRGKGLVQRGHGGEGAPGSLLASMRQPRWVCGALGLARYAGGPAGRQAGSATTSRSNVYGTPVQRFVWATGTLRASKARPTDCVTTSSRSRDRW